LFLLTIPSANKIIFQELVIKLLNPKTSSLQAGPLTITPKGLLGKLNILLVAFRSVQTWRWLFRYLQYWWDIDLGWQRGWGQFWQHRAISRESWCAAELSQEVLHWRW